MISTVLFDLDGLLSDTEKLHKRAYQDVLAGHDVTVSDEAYEEHWIRIGKGIGEFVTENRLAVSSEVVRDEKAVRYDELVRSSVEFMPGAAAILDRLTGKKKLALASSSYRNAVMAVVETLRIGHYFETIVTRDDVEQVKPWPDIFLCAANRLGVAPSSCLVLEDSEKGVIAAHRAGMSCIAIPNRHTKNHDFSTACRVVGSLDEVSLELIGQIATNLEAFPGDSLLAIEARPA
jgi:HAD superfamily hydrolase (TIGR01509 family)